MTADGWTARRSRAGSTHVDKYLYRPTAAEKLRSILEVRAPTTPRSLSSRK